MPTVVLYLRGSDVCQRIHYFRFELDGAGLFQYQCKKAKGVWAQSHACEGNMLDEKLAILKKKELPLSAVSTVITLSLKLF